MTLANPLFVVDAKEILLGITCNLGIVLSREESHLLTNYLDKDGNGSVDWQEFSEKITFRDYQKRAHKYMISEKNLAERLLSEWYTYRGEENKRIKNTITTYDKNGDGAF